MTVTLLCGTRRGLAVLGELQALVPPESIRVVTYEEAAGEPPFTRQIVERAERRGSRVVIAPKPFGPGWEWLWADLDLAMMVHWRSLLPMDVLRNARRGAIVLHDSLLPEYRGFSPTVWAVANGEDRCGVTMFHAQDEVDMGDVVDQEAVEIRADATMREIVDAVTDAYLRVVRRSLHLLLEGTALRWPQDHSRATYACKRSRDDDRIDWTATSARVLDTIRAGGRPYQGAWTTLHGETLSVWEARPAPAERRWVRQVPGRVVEVRDGGVVVMTGDGTVMLVSAGRDNGDVAPAAELIRGLSTTLR